MTAAEARQLLGLSCTFTKKELQSAYAREAKRHHPEEDPEGFARIRSAYTLLLKDAEGVEAAYSGPDFSRDDEGDFSGQRERTETVRSMTSRRSSAGRRRTRPQGKSI